MASCITRTVMRPRRSRASQCRYCMLGANIESANVADSAFDMDFKLLPKRVEIFVELRRIARRKRARPPPVETGKSNGVVGFHLTWPARKHDDALRHADRL